MRPPSKAIEKCYRELESQLADFEPAACVNLLEKLNKEIHRILQHENVVPEATSESTPSVAGDTPSGSGRPGSAGSASSDVQVEEVADTPVSEDGESSSSQDNTTSGDANLVGVGATLPTDSPLESVPSEDGASTQAAIPFVRDISSEENETFTALFAVVKATPRKIKRVVNV